MAIILDSDVIIRGESETFDLQGWLVARSGEQVEIAAITVAELWHGVERADARHRAKRERYVRSAVEGMLVVPTPKRPHLNTRAYGPTSNPAAKRLALMTLSWPATALERGSAVATFNARHFAKVPRLKVIQPG
jgi:predicted nucleic acid-binding protein